VSEDIVNQVTTSHGKLAWHQVDNIGFKALNDALLLEGAVYQLVREHFRREPYYLDLLELLHETRHPAFFRNPVPVSAFRRYVSAASSHHMTRTAQQNYQIPVD
jgi:hypothetical protein